MNNDKIIVNNNRNETTDLIICFAIFVGMMIIGFAIMFAFDLEEQAWKNRHTRIVDGQSCVVLPRN